MLGYMFHTLTNYLTCVSSVPVTLNFRIYSISLSSDFARDMLTNVIY